MFDILTIYWYHNVLENVSEISPKVKDKDSCITTQQSRSHNKTV